MIGAPPVLLVLALSINLAPYQAELWRQTELRERDSGNGIPETESQQPADSAELGGSGRACGGQGQRGQCKERTSLIDSSAKFIQEDKWYGCIESRMGHSCQVRRGKERFAHVEL